MGCCCWRFDGTHILVCSGTDSDGTDFDPTTPTPKATTFSLTECHVLVISPCHQRPHPLSLSEKWSQDSGIMMWRSLTVDRLIFTPL